MPARRFLSALLALCCLQLSPAQAADALAQDMKARLQRSDPALDIVIEAPDRLRLHKAGEDLGVVELGNLREICAKQPGAVCEQQKQRRVALQTQVEDLTSERIPLSELRLVVRPADFQASVQRQLETLAQGKSAAERAKLMESGPVLRPLGAHFSKGWVRDSELGMALLSPAQVRSSGLTEGELDRIGAANLEREEIDPLTAQDGYPGVFATQGNDYLPSALVDEALWQRVAGRHGRSDAAVCLPARHELLVYLPELDPKRRVDFEAMCTTMAQGAAPTFSSRVVRRSGGRWQLD